MTTSGCVRLLIAVLATHIFAPSASCEEVTGPFHQETKSLIKTLIDKQWTMLNYVIFTGPMIVCEFPAEKPAFSERWYSGSHPVFGFYVSLADPSGRRAIYQDLFAKLYAPLQEAGYIEIADGPALSAPPELRYTYSERRSRGRSVSVTENADCSKARQVSVVATDRAKGLAIESDDAHVLLRKHAITQVRVSEDYAITVNNTRIRILKFTFVPQWDRGYQKVGPTLMNETLAPRRKIAAALRCTPEDGRKTRCAWDTYIFEESDLDEDFSWLGTRNDVRENLSKRLSRRR